MQRLKRWAAIAALFACLWFAGDADFEEAQRQEAEYIENICAEVWPDYKGRRPVCD